MSAGRVSIEVSHEEVRAIFRTWAEDRALIRLELRFSVLASSCLARVRAVTDAEVSFASDDK